jgi:hypothetical protein
MSALGAAVDASWYDPTSGDFADVAGAPFPHHGIRRFTPPRRNNAGAGDWVLVLEAPGVAPDQTPPTVPRGLRMVEAGGLRVTIRWNASTDAVRTGGYRVFRDGRFVGITGWRAFTDTGLTPRTTYLYTVAAFDDAGNVSGRSTSLAVRTARRG